MIQFHRDVMAEVDLFHRCTAEVAHAAQFFEVADGHAFGPAACGFHADVGFLGGEDGCVDERCNATRVMDGGIFNLQQAAVGGGDELPDIENNWLIEPPMARTQFCRSGVARA